MFLHGTSTINGRGHLEIGGCDATVLAESFGTPLYVMDEELIRRRCREFTQAFKESGLDYQVAFASKAFCVMAMCRLIEEEGLTLDVVSDGELYTALQAGFPPERIHFHGNNKTPDEIAFGVDAGIGVFVVDNFHELALLNAIAGSKKKTVKILLRVSPGVEAHTHDYMLTGNEDSKFGFDLGSGGAMEAAKQALEQPHLKLLGIHSHIGSQIFEVDGFRMAVDKLMQFCLAVRTETGAEFRVLNLGGGFGVRYVEGDKPLEIADYVKAITANIYSTFTDNGYPVPSIWVEPGRTIVGDAGTTLYTIGSMKELPGIRKYVSVDGGMTDNPRPALYQAKYEAMLANRGHDANEETVSIAGKCCESGDMLIWDLELPKAEAGDILAVSCTGAYNYSMASNYNRIRKPAVVFVKDGEAEVVVRRETHADLIAGDVIPARMHKAPSEAGIR
ncbi:diaminopimelate decarboxylase [Gorillibacterium timonense]|uniref:diaminopimelate decarboxylase n=1 Tax=Gorillibacterium timonense TaxID=1689269 RepID=UPI00071D5922|nr:diaminopimelate decarboxylase [Gorillibacterium timonense]